ncbi:MAG TPA: PEP-CTERM sorting domain-containing protein [Methyloradius sp.]
MKQKYRLLLASLFTITAFSSTVAKAEDSLATILPGFTDAVDSSFAFFATGTVLHFTLVAEQTSWAPYQTFSILEGSTPSTIFAGSASTGATFDYTVGSSYNGFTWGTEPGSGSFVNSFSKILFNDSTGVYALAHEDWTDGDYNDMVITASITPVPEPETYALMLAGLVGIGFVARKKNQA